MEYSKEDLMEAKKQIWGVGENMGTEESKKIWEENAQFWDNAMGDESNEFHREVVRPKVTELLSPNPADYILDIAWRNLHFSLAQDFSSSHLFSDSHSRFLFFHFRKENSEPIFCSVLSCRLNNDGLLTRNQVCSIQNLKSFPVLEDYTIHLQN